MKTNGSIYGSFTSKYTTNTFEYLHLFLFAGFYDAHDVAVQFAAAFLSETARHFLMCFTLAQIPFRIVIMEF